MATLVNIIKDNNTDDVCIISKSIADAFSLVPKSRYKLKFGQSIVYAKLNISEKGKKNSIRISSNLFSKLGIPENLRTNVMIKDDMIMLGPVLGIFTNPIYFRKILQQRPPQSCRHMMNANLNSHIFIYFFTTKGANWADNIIEGCYYSLDFGRWIKKQLPLPDVIFDRCVYNSSRQVPLAENYREHLLSGGLIKRINSKDNLDKYYLYEKLKKYPEIRQYLPYTIKFNNIQDVTAMVEKYNTVYLKSFYGKKGSEVMALSRNKNKALRCLHFHSNKLMIDKLEGQGHLSRKINDFFKDKEFVIQQGIDLLKYGDKRIDMRVLIQKDCSGKWICLYNVAFLGQKDSLIVAGEEKGSHPYNFMEIMPLILNKPSKYVSKLYKIIGDASIKIAEAIEKEYGPFGELGMDMALDKNLKLWFIEANTKPDRQLQSGIIGHARCIACCFNVIEYAKHLSGF